jgi:hypothetical protein
MAAWRNPTAFSLSHYLDPGMLQHTLIVLCAFLVAWGAYRGAIATAMAWGEYVKAAFDLYLPALAGQLGYQLPGTARKRAQFWNDVSSMFLYRERISPGEWGLISMSAPGGESAEGEKEDDNEKEAEEKEGEDGEEKKKDGQQAS